MLVVITCCSLSSTILIMSGCLWLLPSLLKGEKKSDCYMHQWRCVHVCVRLYLCVCVWSSVSAHGYLFAAKPTETKPTKIKMTWIKKEKSRKCLSLDGTFTKCIMHSLWGPAFLLHCLGNVSRNVHNSAKNSPKMQTKHDLMLFFTVCLNPFFVDLVHKCIKLKCEDFMMEVNDCKHNCTLSLFNAHRTKKKKKKAEWIEELHVASVFAPTAAPCLHMV